MCRLHVGEVAVRASDAPFEKYGVASIAQHVFVVIRFQQQGAAIGDVRGDIGTGMPKVREQGDVVIAVAAAEM